MENSTSNLSQSYFVIFTLVVLLLISQQECAAMPYPTVNSASAVTQTSVYATTVATEAQHYGNFETLNKTTPDMLSVLIPPATVEPDIHLIKKEDTLQRQLDCPSLENGDQLSQTLLMERLTHECRYDKLERPAHASHSPVKVYVRTYIYFMQNLEPHDLQFKAHILLQLRYVDARLAFKKVAPNRTEPIMGEQQLWNKLWVPHLFLANEKSSGVLGTPEKDMLTSVSPDGTVILSKRLQATLFCWMNLQKFPFDTQHCHAVFESWMYNASDLLLLWEQESPLHLAPELHLTEYVLMDFWTNETLINASLKDLRHGAFVGNYSSLSFTVYVGREMGYYLLDYFIPSWMIVSTSWVTFWLQADQTAPRVTLGGSTMLTFITLASSQGKTLPKVSYIKASEIWFLGCTTFIFASLAEFAFVNIIWRRKKNVELKKVNSKYIMKSTLTPRLARREIGGGGLHKSRSCSSLEIADSNGVDNSAYNPYLTVHGNNFSSQRSIPSITIVEEGQKDQLGAPSESQMTLNSNEPAPQNRRKMSTWTTMTPHEIAIWIDKRSRIVFPLAFLVFNIFYWSFVYMV